MSTIEPTAAPEIITSRVTSARYVPMAERYERDRPERERLAKIAKAEREQARQRETAATEARVIARWHELLALYGPPARTEQGRDCYTVIFQPQRRADDSLDFPKHWFCGESQTVVVALRNSGRL
jgi:hypothetical protein